MAKKEKLKVAKVDLDNDLEIPEFDFDLPPPKDDRKPANKLVGGILKGAKSTLFSSDFIKSSIRKSLPDGFGEALNMADQVGTEAKKLYNNAVNQIKPSLNEMSRAASKLAPNEKVKTKAALDSVSKWSENASAKYKANDQDSQREAGITLALDDMFKFQATQAITATANQNIKDNVQTGLEIARHRDNFGMLNNINMGVSKLTQYQEKVTATYQKKSIELQYRSYFVAADMLEESKKQNALVKAELANITKNTALPEIVKTTQHETFKNTVRNKFWSNVNDGLFGGRNDIVGKISKNIGDALRDKLSSASDAFSAAAMGMETAHMMAESGMGGPGGIEGGGNLAGGFGMDYLGSELGSKLNKFGNKHKKIGALSRQVGSGVKNLPQHLNEFKKGNAGIDKDDDKNLTKVGNFFLRALKTVIPNMDTDTVVEYDQAEKLTDIAHFNKQTNKSINEVIPGYLSRIFRELQVLRTGDTKIGLTTYDFNKNKFSSYKENVKSNFSKIMGSSGESDISNVINLIDPNNKLSKSAREALGKKLNEDRKAGKAPDIKQLMNRSEYTSEYLQPHANTIRPHLQKHFKLDDKGDAKDPEDFDTKARSSQFKNLLTTGKGTTTQVQVNELMNMLDPDGTKLNKEARVVLSKKLLSDNFDTRLGSSKRFSNKDTFSGNDTKGYAELFAKTFKDYFNGDESKDKEVTFNSKFNDLGKSTTDSRGFIQNMINLGQVDLLRSTGLLSKDDKIDLKKLQSYHLGEELNLDDEDFLASNAKNDSKSKMGITPTSKGKIGSSLSPLLKINKAGFERLAISLDELNNKQTTVNATVTDDSNKSTTLLNLIELVGNLTVTKLEEIRLTITSLGGSGGNNSNGNGYQSNGSVMDALKTLSGAGIDVAGKLLKGGFNLGNKLASSIPNISKKVANVATFGLSSLKAGADLALVNLHNLTKIKDVFIAGEVEPRIEEMKLKAGKYFVEAADGTRTVLKDISGIKGKIIDELGNTVIAADELGKMFTKSVKGKGITKLITKGFGFIFEKGNKASSFLLNSIPPALKSIGAFAKMAQDKIIGFLDQPIDIYVPGIELPVMTALVMRNGGYISKKTQKTIMRPNQIDGAVLNSDGNVVLTEEDIKKGLRDKNGKAIKTPFDKIKDFAFGALKKTFAFGHKVSKQAFSIAKSGLKHAGNLLTGGINGLMGGINGTGGIGGGKENTDILKQIRDILDQRLTKPKKTSFNDKDGDGERDGGWRSMSKRLRKPSAKKDGPKADSSKGDGHKNTFDLIEEKAKAIKDGISDLVGGAKDLLTSGSTKGVLGKSKSILGKGASMLGRGASVLGRGALALGGVGLSGAASAAGAVGSAALTGAGALGSAALTGAGAIASGIGAAGSFLLASPVLLGIAAVAAVGTIGYFGYKYLTRNSATKLELVRYTQYGFKADKKDYISKVFGLEDVLIEKYVTYNNGVASLTDKDFDIEKAYGIFDIKKEDEEMVKRWTWWFTKHFKPVFLTHLTALFNTNDKVKLKDTDKLTAEEKLKYLKAAAFADGPYGENDSPIKDMSRLLATSDDVQAAITDAELEIRKDIKKEDKTDKSTLATGAAITGAIAIAGSTDKSDPLKTTTDKLDPNGKKLNSIEKVQAGIKDDINKVGTSKMPLLGMMGLTGAVLGGPVTLGIAALGAVSFMAFKALGPGKESKLKDFRYAQYGSKRIEGMNNTDVTVNASALNGLENLAFKCVTFTDGVAKFNDKSFDIPIALKMFGVSQQDEKIYNNWVSWFTGRFKPIFLTHLTALYSIDRKVTLEDINDLLAEEKLKYLNLVKFDDGPYDIADSPFLNMQEIVVTRKDITDAFNVAKDEIEKDSKSEKTTLLGALKVTERNANKTPGTADIQPGQTNVGDDIKKTGGVLSFMADKFTSLIATPLIAVGNAIGRFFGFNATPLETIRFKTYGLKSLERSKVSTLRTLEAEVFKNVKYDSNGTATWSSTAEAIIKTNGKDFGIESPSSPAAKDWINWFVKRFLPVYLSFLGLVKQATGKEDISSSEQALKINQQIDIATKISSTSDVWSITSSPWEGYELLTDSKQISENLGSLKAQAEKDELIESKKKTEDKNKGTSSLATQQKVNEAGGLTKSNIVKSAIDSKGPVDGETPIKESGASAVPFSAASNGVPAMAGGPIVSGLNADQYLKLGPGAKLDGLNPEMLKNFNGMVEDYGISTGKSVYVTSGARTFEEQAALFKKDPSKAARPGNSLHEYGLALDVSSSTLDELDKLGYMRKYGFTRPVGGETWHIEPSGIQGNIDGAKKDQVFASNAVASSLGKGGGGFGSIKGSPLSKRNASLAKQIYEGTSPPLMTADEKSKALSAPIQTADTTKINTDKSSGYTASVQPKNAISSPDVENGKVEDFKSTVPGSSSGLANVPDPKNGKGLEAVRATIEGAAKVTGVDPKLMLGMAGIESNFDPNAKATGSSASGLYQFTASTWDDMLSKKGSKYGLDMNTSPLNAKASALMGGEYIKTNMKTISSSKPNPTSTDLYMAHFLGGSGANKLFAAPPDTKGADLMPKAAKANPSIFYNGESSRSTGEIYSLMDNKVNKQLTNLGLSSSPSSNTPSNNPGNILSSTSKDAPSIATVTQKSPSLPNTTSDVSPSSSLSNGETIVDIPKSSNTDLGSILAQSPSNNNGFMNTSYSNQPQQDPRHDMNAAIGTVSDTLVKSLDVQTKIFTVLQSILAKTNSTGTSNAMNNNSPGQETNVKPLETNNGNSTSTRSDVDRFGSRPARNVPVPMNRQQI